MGRTPETNEPGRLDRRRRDERATPRSAAANVVKAHADRAEACCARWSSPFTNETFLPPKAAG